MDIYASVCRELSNLCPPGVGVSCLPPPLDACALLPPETAITAAMVDKRRIEFTHGRICARAAMAQLGLPAHAIGKGSNREPVWPAGLTGSITHTGELAAAVVARLDSLTSIGLDIEGTDVLGASEAALVCLPEENLPHDGERAKQLFSAKEAVYKCLYPLVGTYIDFLEMELQLNSSRGKFSATPRTDTVSHDLARRLEGRQSRIGDLLISIAWIA
jgi:4'-phosphopantetheinyl transferase EntD